MNRILALCMSPDQGGLELYFLKLVKYYRLKLNRNIHVACSEDSYISNQISENKIICKSKSFIKNIFILRKYINDNGIDTIHVSWAKDLFLSDLLKKLSKKPIKLIFYRQMKLSRPKKDIYHKFIYRNIDHFLVITKKLYNESCIHLPIDNSKIHLLTYGIEKPSENLIVTKEKFFNQSQLDTSVFTIGVFSRIEEQKGQHLVLQAINKSNHDIQLCVIGHCMNHEYKNRLIEDIQLYKLNQKVKFIDFVNMPMTYMPCFDLVVLPTYEETFGLIVVEAMLMKVPVIGSNAGGVPEIITNKHNGLLFETKNYVDLQKKIDQMIEDVQLRQKIIHNGYEHSIKYYDYDNHFNKLEKIINQ